jgi:hypothetical protein
MRNKLAAALYGFMFTSAVIIAVLQGYLFLFADCQTVKENWLITQTPARCIK